MTLTHWLRNTKEYYQQYSPTQATRMSAREFYQGAAQRAAYATQHFPNRGVPVYDHDWDILVVLDACRRDALQAVADEYDWLPDRIPRTRSVASMSGTWMARNFESGDYDAEKARTAHVTWNAFSHRELDPDDWHLLAEVWREVWDEDRGCVPPRAISDRAIETWRWTTADQMIVHYQQPHTPFRQFADSGVVETLNHEQVWERDSGRRTVWDRLRTGELTRADAWSAYLDNLRWVLDDVAVLRENLDGDRVLLTADHGDLFGKYGLYGHPKNIRVSELVTVPLVPVSVRDTGSYQPEPWGSTDEDQGVDRDDPDVDVAARLVALGYREEDTNP